MITKRDSNKAKQHILISGLTLSPPIEMSSFQESTNRSEEVRQVELGNRDVQILSEILKRWPGNPTELEYWCNIKFYYQQTSDNQTIRWIPTLEILHRVNSFIFVNMEQYKNSFSEEDYEKLQAIRAECFPPRLSSPQLLKQDCIHIQPDLIGTQNKIRVSKLHHTKINLNKTKFDKCDTEYNPPNKKLKWDLPEDNDDELIKDGIDFAEFMHGELNSPNKILANVARNIIIQLISFDKMLQILLKK